MFIDANQIAVKELQADICIIGAGAAGITLAQEFRSSKASVLLIESGDFQISGPTQSLYQGHSSGTFLKEDSPYLEVSRLRYFGGTTNHWTGWVRPFDSIDFESRSWIPNSGWPFGREHLEPFYQRAAKALNLPTLVQNDFPEGGVSLLQGSSSFVDRIFQIYPRRFGLESRDELSAAENVKVLLNANVVDLVCGADDETLSHVLFSTLAGQRKAVKARLFILASGGVENVRLLLNSSNRHSTGLCNSNDLVGRYFSDHPHMPSGLFVYSDDKPSARYFYLNSTDKESRLLTTMSPSSELIRKEGLLNFSIQFQTPRPDALSLSSKHIGNGFARGDAYRQGRDVQSGTTLPIYSLFMRAEQIPNPESRITLGSERDALGQRKVRLKWQLTEKDRELYRRGLELLVNEFGKRAAGKVRLLIGSEGQWPENSRGGNHHLGTTRMHSDPRLGVVNSDCRTHAVRNLYIAGSSVFPTTSCVNPTLTILALTLRLADHLKGILTL